MISTRVLQHDYYYSFDHGDQRIRPGAILSGNEFVGRVDRKRAVAGLLEDSLPVEMEAAGVAQLAERLKIPFVVAKTVADRLSPEGTIDGDFRECLVAASAHAAAALHSIL